MAIKMVRQPSDTPNISNIDDIIGLRYAYGNNNGYVIGKGTELGCTVNGSTFVLNSGRVVLQGVESDIDANGVSITVDNAAELRYFTLFYQVNLATNSTSIELSAYDTAKFPEINVGDDLTQVSSGIAKLPLYHFTADNGIIGNIEKLVNPLKYAKDILVEDATNSKTVNGLEIKENENGVLMIGDIIIPQKKLLWGGNYKITSSYAEALNINDVAIDTFANQIFEIMLSYQQPNPSSCIGDQYFKVKTSPTISNSEKDSFEFTLDKDSSINKQSLYIYSDRILIAGNGQFKSISKIIE